MKKIKKQVYIFFYISLFGSILIFLYFYNSMYKIKKINIETKKIKVITSDSNEYLYYIDEIEKKNEKLFIEGWLLKKNEDNNVIDRVIILEDSQKKYYKLFTQSVLRTGITEHFNDGKNYDNTGLIAKGKINKSMKPPFKIYFFIKNKNDELLLDTEKIIN